MEAHPNRGTLLALLNAAKLAAPNGQPAPNLWDI